MGDKPKYEGKTQGELQREAQKRGLDVAPDADENTIRQALETDDKSQQGDMAGSKSR